MKGDLKQLAEYYELVGDDLMLRTVAVRELPGDRYVLVLDPDDDAEEIAAYDSRAEAQLAATIYAKTHADFENIGDIVRMIEDEHYFAHPDVIWRIIRVASSHHYGYIMAPRDAAAPFDIHWSSGSSYLDCEDYVAVECGCDDMITAWRLYQAITGACREEEEDE